MSDKSAPDPTMDEILASIRRIISEDPAPQGPARVAAAESVVGRIPDDPPEPHADPESRPDAEPDHPRVAQALEELIDEEKMTDTHSSADEPLVGEAAASASASAFDALATTAGQHAAAHPAIALPAPGRTLEDLTADLLRPLLKTWLDENLPEIVRDRVDEEVRRIARSRVR